MIPNDIVQFFYTNHRGERSLRTVRPIRLWYGSTAWYPFAQYLLEGFDLDRMETRDYAVASIETGTWKPAPKGYGRRGQR